MSMENRFFFTEKFTVGYGKTTILQDMQFFAEKGQILTLIGPNGAGKTTLLKSIARQLAPLGGRAVLLGQELWQMSTAEAARRMAVMLTDRGRPELMTCFEVAAAGRYPYTGRLGVLSAQDREKVRAALQKVHAWELAEKQFSQISDGQKQRVLLAKALCQEPELLILDEPTSFLDVRHKLELLTILKELVAEKQIAVIMTLHELDLAQKVSDKILCAAGGGIDRYGTPEEIFEPGYIESLYDVERGSYNALYGSLELEAPAGAAQVFVIGGGGAGIPVYRRLQRSGVPFAAGVLAENDLDTPVARALAAKVFTVPEFEPVSREAAENALQVLCTCRAVFCPQTHFGPMNAENRRLLQEAEKLGILQG